MKIKNKIFLVSILLLFGFLGQINLAKAACCLDTCLPPTGALCDDASIPNPADCSPPACPVVNKCCLNGSICQAASAGACSPGFSPYGGGKDCTELMPPAIGAQCLAIDNTASGDIEFPNPIKPTTVMEVLNSVLDNMMGIIVVIAIIFIIIGGIMYMTSGGNEKMVTMGKKAITGAVVGLAIALAAPSFLKEIKSILETDTTTGTNADDWVNQSLTLKEIAMNVMKTLLSSFGVIAIIVLVIAGIMYLTAGGDDKKAETGKKMFKWAVIGIIVALSSLVIVREIDKLIGARL